MKNLSLLGAALFCRTRLSMVQSIGDQTNTPGQNNDEVVNYEQPK